MEGALRLLASGEALEQMLQVCERDMAETDEAVSDLTGERFLSGKRKRGDELAHQAVRHSLGEQGPLGTGHYARQGRIGSEGTGPWWSVEAGLVRAGDVAQCPVPTGGEGGNGEGLARGKAGGAAPEEGAVDSAGVGWAATTRLEPQEEALEQVLQDSDSQIQQLDCLVKVDFLGNGSLDPPKPSCEWFSTTSTPLAARVCPGKFIGIFDFAARAARSGGPGRCSR